jgi:ankyrin repeat protein
MAALLLHHALGVPLRGPAAAAAAAAFGAHRGGLGPGFTVAEGDSLQRLVNTADDRGCTPVHYACAAGAARVIVQVLAPAGAAVAARTAAGLSTLHVWAAGSLQLPPPVALRPALASASPVAAAASIDAAPDAHELQPADVVARLLVFEFGLSPHEAAPGPARATPLHLAAAAGAYDRVAALLDPLVGCDPNARDACSRTPLQVVTGLLAAAGAAGEHAQAARLSLSLTARVLRDGGAVV